MKSKTILFQAQQKKLQKLWAAQEKKYNNYLKSQGQWGPEFAALPICTWPLCSSIQTLCSCPERWQTVVTTWYQEALELGLHPISCLVYIVIHQALASLTIHGSIWNDRHQTDIYAYFLWQGIYFLHAIRCFVMDFFIILQNMLACIINKLKSIILAALNLLR